MFTPHCLYQLIGGYANRAERNTYDCPHCKPDEFNRRCKYYKPIVAAEITVRSHEGESSHEKTSGKDKEIE